MAVRLFDLKGVPEDETQEVCALLEQAGMDFYETPPGRWGVSVHALWLQDEGRAAEARQLLSTYQESRRQRMRAAYDAERRAGTAPTLWQQIRAQPLRVALLLALIVLVLYFSIKPFHDM